MPGFEIDDQLVAAGRTGLMKQDVIRNLNDELRTTFEGGKVVLSHGVTSMPGDYRDEVLLAVRLFWQFEPENDPYEEHDFGAVTCRGTRFMFKIDYYDLDLRYAAEDPSDPAFTIRVMTILRADEY